MIIGSNLQAVNFTGKSKENVTITNQSTLVEAYNPIQQEAKEVFEVGQIIGKSGTDKILALVLNLNESDNPLSVENKEQLETLVKNLAEELKLTPKQEEKLKKITSKAMENVSKMSPEEKQKLIKCFDKVAEKNKVGVNCIGTLLLLCMLPETSMSPILAIMATGLGSTIAIAGLVEHMFSSSAKDTKDAFNMICLGALL